MGTIMEYRLNKQKLFEILSQWNGFLKKKVHLIACGGTALTLMDIKESTKDVDFMVPKESEYKHLTKTLKDLGYLQTGGAGWYKKDEGIIFDLFCGDRIHTTELLQSPLDEGNHSLLKEYSRIYVGILNEYDLIASKLFRGTAIDFDDCMMLVKARKNEIDINKLGEHSKELASYDVSEVAIVKKIDMFFDLLKDEGLLS